ncbi:MAG: hypothetical protein PHX62_07095, partial [Bacilli bacterium]|nr:hypothetical protein [Bacilli bacterium]
EYRQNKDILSANDSLEIMWEIGELLKKYLKNNSEIKPHNLYRQIYGKSEGTSNTTQKSYITREFLGRCLRIRNIFLEKKEIKITFPNLSRFTNFRESMPFFDNKKYKLMGKEKEQLLTILNSNLSNIKIFQYIRKLQKEKIGIKNPRDQKLKLLTEDKDIFVNFYNYIYGLLKEKNYQLIQKELVGINSEFMKIISKNTGAIAIDGLQTVDFTLPENKNTSWFDYLKLLKKLISSKNPKERRRFRRLIPPHRMTRLAEMIYLLTSEDLYKKFND